jgi:hypothetical protein
MRSVIDRILDYEDVLDAGPDGVNVAPATFKINFGPWKKGYKAACVSLDDDMLIEWTAEGAVVA